MQFSTRTALRSVKTVPLAHARPKKKATQQQHNKDGFSARAMPTVTVSLSEDAYDIYRAVPKKRRSRWFSAAMIEKARYEAPEEYGVDE
mgnify:FL=1